MQAQYLPETNSYWLIQASVPSPDVLNRKAKRAERLRRKQRDRKRRNG